MLDAHLPNADGAHEELVTDIFEKCPSRLAKEARVTYEPSEGVGIEQITHLPGVFVVEGRYDFFVGRL